MSQHSQVVTLFQMPQKCHEKYPCTKIFIPCFFKNFPKFWNFLPSGIFLQNIQISILKISAWKISKNGFISIKNAYVFKYFWPKINGKLRNFTKNFQKKFWHISPHSWFLESMKNQWFSRIFSSSISCFASVWIFCWVYLLLRILSWCVFLWKFFYFWDFFSKIIQIDLVKNIKKKIAAYEVLPNYELRFAKRLFGPWLWWRSRARRTDLTQQETQQGRSR